MVFLFKTQIVSIPTPAITQGKSPCVSLALSRVLDEMDQNRDHSFEINSFVRGYHAYISVWDPVVSEELNLEREPGNIEDQRAVAVKKNGQVVGHMPRHISPTVFFFFIKAMLLK